MPEAEIIPFPNADPFEEFWKAYPSCKRVGKPVARAKFKAITNGGLKTKTLDRDSGSFIELELQATPQEIIDGVKRYAARNYEKNSYKWKDGGKFILMPATFLNQGRWMDE